MEIRAFGELGEKERPDVEALIVANEPVPLELFPNLRLVANFGVGYDRLDVEEPAGAASRSRTRRAFSPPRPQTSRSR